VTEEEDRLAAQKLREQKEADLVKNRIEELHERPIAGNFDADHLKAVHAYIFQDLRHHRPGVTRDDTAETWIKHRALENSRARYDVPYVSQDVESKIAASLDQFGGPETIRGLPQDKAAERIARLYGDLDHAHGFYEGNSRTLREFTRELAAEAGFKLDWVQSGVGTAERNALYIARDLAVLERAFPDLTPENAKDRREYEASIIIDDLKRAVGNKPLSAIIRTGLSSGVERPRERDNSQPLTADEVLSRFGDPDKQARYERQGQQEQQRREQDDTAAPRTAAERAEEANVPAEKRAEHKESQEKSAKNLATTRDIGDGDRKRDRGKDRDDNDRGGRPRGGGGGRSRR
jgi:cell filamentation protein